MGGLGRSRVMLKNTIDNYGSVARTLHWLIAVLVIGMLIFGFLLESIPKPIRGEILVCINQSD